MRYARDVSAAAYLADLQLSELETQLRKDGWPTQEKTEEGDFDKYGWPNMTYMCKVHWIDIPDFSEMLRAQEEAGTEGMGDDGVLDAAEQGFGMMGMVWPLVRGVIEKSIRKADCTVMWMDGKVQEEVKYTTFWTDPGALSQLPMFGGAVTGSEGGESEGTGGGAGDPAVGVGVGGPATPGGRRP